MVFTLQLSPPCQHQCAHKISSDAEIYSDAKHKGFCMNNFLINNKIETSWTKAQGGNILIKSHYFLKMSHMKYCKFSCLFAVKKKKRSQSQYD